MAELREFKRKMAELRFADVKTRHAADNINYTSRIIPAEFILYPYRLHCCRKHSHPPPLLSIHSCIDVMNQESN